MTRAALVGTFTYPVENGLLFYDGETINVSWTSTLSNASLSLYCRYESDSTWNTYEISSIGLVDSIGSKQVDVVIEKSSDYCWFNLFETGDDADGVNSVTFLISSDVHSGTTIGLSGVATTSYAGVGVPTGPVTAATTTATTTSTDVTSSASSSTIETSTKSVTASLASGKSSGDLSTGAKAGIGAGVGVASLMLLGACLFWFLRRRRGRGNGQVFAEGQRETAKEKTALMDAVEIGAAKRSAWHPDTVQEMSDSQRPFELHASTGPYTGHTAELDG
ncbi:hypothetical protein N7504_004973 [Penicillium tannophilum]|nr:hypothetical protein N7504_004973 [Penicillium tannophilum]